MKKLIFNRRPFACRRLFVFAMILAASICAAPDSFAHQSPTTLVFLDISPDQVRMELRMPLGELELAFGNDVTKNTETLVQRLQPQLRDYLINRIHPVSGANQLWAVRVSEMKVGEAEQTQSGPYQEITVHLILTPPAGVSSRRFALNYDVIMHQVVTHSALVAVRRDWETAKPVNSRTGSV